MHTLLPTVVAVAGLVLAACADVGEPGADPFVPVSAGTLTVCSDAPVAPFVVEDPDAPGGYSGFEIDLIRAIAEGLDLDLAVRDVAFESIVSGAAMADGDCDVAASAIAMLDEWAADLAYSDPHYSSRQSLLVMVGSGIQDVAGTEGRPIGVVSGTAGEDDAEHRLPDGTQIVTFATSGDMLAALERGSIDGAVQDVPANAEWARTGEDVEVVDTFGTGDRYAFAVAADREDDLLEALNDQLMALRGDGTYDQLYEGYFGTTP